MKGQLLHLLPLLSSLVPSHAGPVLARHGGSEGYGRTADARLLGSSFGVPGNQSFDYVIVGGGTAGMSPRPTYPMPVSQSGTD